MYKLFLIILCALYWYLYFLLLWLCFLWVLTVFVASQNETCCTESVLTLWQDMWRLQELNLWPSGYNNHFILLIFSVLALILHVKGYKYIMAATNIYISVICGYIFGWILNESLRTATFQNSKIFLKFMKQQHILTFSYWYNLNI